MKQFGKWFGSSLLIVASLFMVTSVLSSCDKPTDSSGGQDGTGKKMFKVTYDVVPQGEGTVTAMLDGKPFESGKTVEEGKTLKFTLTIKPGSKYKLDKWDGATKKEAMTAELKVMKETAVKAILKEEKPALPKLEFKEMKIHGVSVVQDKTDKNKLTVKVPADKTNVATANVTDAKFEYGTSAPKTEVSNATITVKNSPVSFDNTGKAEVEVMVAGKANAYDATTFKVIVTKTSAKPKHKVILQVKYNNQVVTDKATLTATYGSAKIPITSNVTEVPEGEEINFTVAMTEDQKKKYRVKTWTGATEETGGNTEKLKAKATMSTSDLTVMVELEDVGKEKMKAKTIKINSDANAGNPTLLHELTKEEIAEAAKSTGYTYYYKDDQVKGFVVAEAETQGATVKYKLGDADCDGSCDLATVAKEMTITISKQDCEDGVYKIKLAKLEAPNDHQVKTVMICGVEVTANDLYLASLSANKDKGVTVKVKKASLATSHAITWTDGSAAPGDVKVTYCAKGGSDTTSADCHTTHTSDLPTEADKYPVKVTLVVKKAAGSAENETTTYVFNVVAE